MSWDGKERTTPAKSPPSITGAKLGAMLSEKLNGANGYRDGPAMEANSKSDTGRENWLPPQPLINPTASAPYPMDALPPVIREAVEEVRAFVQAPNRRWSENKGW